MKNELQKKLEYLEKDQSLENLNKNHFVIDIVVVMDISNYFQMKYLMIIFGIAIFIVFI